MAFSWSTSPQSNNPKIFPKDSEIEISVDPISYKEHSSPGVTFPNFVMPNYVRTRPNVPPSLPVSRSKFVSVSLPNSAFSSPRFSSGKLAKKSKSQIQDSPFSVNPLAGQQSVALARLAQLREKHFQKSKSCDERANAPFDDFDLWLTKVNTDGNEDKYPKKVEIRKNIRKYHDEEFKCGALCLYLPGFGKGKPVKSRKDQEPNKMGHVISRTVSLEKFECGSWTSSAIMNTDCEDEEDASKHYFDLPLELIRSSANEANSPVKAAFLFDKDPKRILKNNSKIMTRKPCDQSSSRHVRFSPSPSNINSPTTSPCITPRLRKAREDFNAFLEAQSV